MATRRRSQAVLGVGGAIAVALAVLVIGGGGTIASLAYLGVLGARPSAQTRPSRAGLVAVPRSTRDLKAYHKITRDDIYDLHRGDDSYLWVDPATIERNPDWIVKPGEIIGRVMARDSEPGYVFKESDFLPRGTREGVVAGVPAGKRAMVVSASKIQGLGLLARGDRFDLFATLPVKASGGSMPEISVLASEEDTLTGGTRTPESRAASIQNRLGVKLLVRGGMLVDASEPPARAPANARNAPKVSEKEVTIAVSPEEVISLTHALTLNYSVFCAARSGRPEDKEGEEPTHPLVRGMIAVPVRARQVSPLAALTRDDLLDTATGQLSVLYFAPDQVQPDWITDVERIIDRVAARDLYAGMPFREIDFQPLGTRAGIAGGTPPGKLALPIARNRIHGLSELQQGDQFDLIANVPVDLWRQFPQLRLGAASQNVPGYDRLMKELQKHAAVTLLVQNGAVVANGGGDAPITIAVTPQEVAVLTKALAADTPIYGVVRSGHIAENGGVAIDLPENPLKGIAVVEKLSGKDRSLEVFATNPMNE